MVSKKIFGLMLGSMIASASIFAKNSVVNMSQERLEALAKYTKVIQTVEKYYVDEINITDIVNKSLQGLMQNLDAHSSYMLKKDFDDMKVQTNGEFGGLGITVGMRDGALTVIAPIEGTPADKVGLKAGDIILKIDDKSTLNMTIDEAVKLMRGKPKTKIHLTIVRKGESKPLEFTIIRDIIKIQSVYTKKIEGTNILYIRVTSFDKKVVRNVHKALKENKNIKGIILDLRNNPGGLLDQAVGLVDTFVDSGVIVSQKGRIKSEDVAYKATKEGTYKDIPMAVIVNGGSASASEITSGALQDDKRAIIVGEKTFGKGSVQVILPMGNGEGLRLTVARYYLPSGRTIQAKGVTPDIIVHPGEIKESSEDEFTLKEAELKKHLKAELEKIQKDKKDKQKDKKEEKNKDKKDKKSIITKEDIKKDAQLKCAIDAVKIQQIMKK